MLLVRIEIPAARKMEEIAQIGIRNTGFVDRGGRTEYVVYKDGVQIGEVRHRPDDGAFVLVQKALEAVVLAEPHEHKEVST